MRKGGIANALQFEAAPRRISLSGCFLAKYVLRTRTNCYFRASDKYSDTAVGFGDPHFIHDTNILAVGGHLPCDLDV